MAQKIIGLDLAKREGFNKAITSRVSDTNDTYLFQIFDNGVLFDLTKATQIALLGLTPSGKYVDATGVKQTNGIVLVTIPSAFNSEIGYFQRCFIRVTTTDGQILSTQDLIYYSYGDADISAGGGADYISRVETLMAQLNKDVEDFEAGLDTKYNETLAEIKSLTNSVTSLSNQVTALKNQIDTQKVLLKTDIATQAQNEAGTSNSVVVTPLGISQFLKANPQTPPTATQAEVTTGTNTSKTITPATLKGEYTRRTATVADWNLGTNTEKFINIPTLKNIFTAKTATQDEVNTGTETGKYVTPATLQQKLNTNDFSVKVSDWTAVTLNSDWQNADGTTLQYRILTYNNGGSPKKKVEFSGSINLKASNNIPSQAGQYTVTTLPSVLLPTQTVLSAQATSGYSITNRVAVSQQLVLYVGNASNTTVNYINLSGFSYWLAN